MNLADRDTLCFGCGKDNPIGLHMHFKVDEEGCYASFVPQPVHQSYVADTWAFSLYGQAHEELPYLYEHPVAYTARLEVRFRQPVLIGEKISIITKVKKRKSILLQMTGQVVREDGTIAAEG